MRTSVILEYSSGEWELNRINYPNDPIPSEICYIFLDKKTYPDVDRDNPKSENDREKSELSRGDLLRPFNMPNFLSSDICTDANGYFGCRGAYDKDENLESYNTWFRCLVKMLHKADEVAQSGKGYIWYEMGIFTSWDCLGRCRVLCIDTPEELPSKLKEILVKTHLDPRDPFAMHAPLMDQIIKLYDDSIWAIRHPIRRIEKTRRAASPDFIEMHEISRHAIHISEILSVTIETIESIQRQQKSIYENFPGLGKTYREQAREYTGFQLQLIKALKHRSCSNYERLRIETTLAYNMLAQQDNYIIKSVALLTMTFLPATFVSSFFSTTFFSFGKDSWQASRQLWVYWVVTIASTFLVVLAWRVWLSGPIQNPFASATLVGKFSSKGPQQSQKEAV